MQGDMVLNHRGMSKNVHSWQMTFTSWKFQIHAPLSHYSKPFSSKFGVYFIWNILSTAAHSPPQERRKRGAASSMPRFYCRVGWGIKIDWVCSKGNNSPKDTIIGGGKIWLPAVKHFIMPEKLSGTENAQWGEHRPPDIFSWGLAIDIVGFLVSHLKTL